MCTGGALVAAAEGISCQSPKGRAGVWTLTGRLAVKWSQSHLTAALPVIICSVDIISDLWRSTRNSKKPLVHMKHFGLPYVLWSLFPHSVYTSDIHSPMFVYPFWTTRAMLEIPPQLVWTVFLRMKTWPCTVPAQLAHSGPWVFLQSHLQDTPHPIFYLWVYIFLVRI